MSDDPLCIDGKLVTERNARRFVVARCPSAVAERETGWDGWRRTKRVVVRERGVASRTPWCWASAPTAGEAWLKVARQMVAHDERVAAQKLEIDQAVDALRAAEPGPALEAAALRYAAVRYRHHERIADHHKGRIADLLIEMAAEIEAGRGG